MDKIIKKILEKIEYNGYEAYLVGGYVRDLLLGVKSLDVDICTSALPKDIYNIFNVDANKYGGVNLIINNYNIDITTFREEKEYNNGKPIKINYVKNLKEDLIRRDFTINAICMDKKGKIIDLLNGINDLNNRTIKMIGNTNERLKEDPSRIIRAIRFATVLKFNLNDELKNGIKENANLINSISKNKIREELDKILLNENYMEGVKLLKEFELDKHLGIIFNDFNYTKDLMGIYAQIKTDDIPFTNNEKSTIISITEIVKYKKIDYWTLFNYGLYVNLVAGEILNVDSKLINKMYKKMPIKDRKDIQINGNEIMDLLNIKPGNIINKIYDQLIIEILNGKLKNKKSDIKLYLLKRK